MKYPNNLKALREEQGISQNGLSISTGISVRTIQHYEQGSRDLEGARLETLLNLTNVLGCSLRDLFINDKLVHLLEITEI